jgi:uncharacterized peroxidase-related enzyme
MGNQLRLWILNACLGEITSDAARAAFYRPGLFSKSYFKFQHRLMRGKSEWSIAERELFAANVASRIQCEFCRVSHSAFASEAKKKPGWASSIMNGQSQEDQKLQVVLNFLNKLTEQPWGVTTDDIDGLRQQGMSNRAIEEAAMICVLFSIGSRLSTAFDFRIPSEENLKRATPAILRFGYLAFS